MASKGETKSLTNVKLDTSKLVELLQQSAVEHLTTFRELMTRYFGDSQLFVTTDFKALYAYKCGQYQHCLQLSIRAVRALIYDQRMEIGSAVLIYRMFIQLLDDDIVSFIGLTVLVNPSHGCDDPLVGLFQLSLSLYLMTQCQIKLRHSLTSLATTLDYVELARAVIERNTRLALDQFAHGCEKYIRDNQLLLKFVEQKILRYVSADHQS